MREMFEVNQRKNLISFIGKYPDGRPMVCELVPKNFEGGLLYRMVEEIVKEDDLFKPVLDSYEVRDCNISFKLVHQPTDTRLHYSSLSSFAGYWRDFKDFYQETLSVQSNLSKEVFNLKLKELDFLKDRFGDAKKKNSLEVASDEEIAELKYFISAVNKGYEECPW